MSIPKISYISFCLFILINGCGLKIANVGSAGKNIICFGNSITEGEGSTPGNDYPALLSKKLDTPVINAGVNGETTRDALKRLEKEVLEQNPRLVMVEFCGNDFFQSIPKQETFDNLKKVISAIQEKGAMVVLVEVRAGYFQDEYIEGFRRLARERQALLIPNIMGGILLNQDLISSDQIHPNDKGYSVIADRIYKAIKPLLAR